MYALTMLPRENREAGEVQAITAWRIIYPLRYLQTALVPIYKPHKQKNEKQVSLVVVKPRYKRTVAGAVVTNIMVAASLRPRHVSQYHRKPARKQQPFVHGFHKV